MSIILYQDGLIVQGRLAQNMDHALIQGRLVQMFGFNGKAKQVEVLYDLVVEKKDTILLAKTGPGKSILFQALSILLGACRCIGQNEAQKTYICMLDCIF